MFLFGIPGCTGKSSVDNNLVELSIWTGWTGAEEIGFNKLLTRYSSLHPNIKFHNLAGVNDDTKTLRALIAGVPPDVFALWDSTFLGPFARNHAIRPLDELFQQSGLREQDFIPASLGMARYHGHLYAMPLLVDISALFTNKQAFVEAGLDPNRAPQTIEELSEYIVKLTKRDSSGRITQLGMAPPLDASGFFLISSLFGGRLFDRKTGAVTADDPGILAAANWSKKLTDRLGGIDQMRSFASGFGQAQGPSNPFFVGKVAMMISGEYSPYWIERYAPKLQYGIAAIPPPASHPENREVVAFGGNNFCIPSESRHPKEAWDFLVWLQSAEAQIQFSRTINNIPNIRAALHSSELREGTAYRKRFASLMDLVARAKGSYVPATPVSNLYMNQMGSALDSVLFGDKTPQKAFADVRIRVQKELAHQ